MVQSDEIRQAFVKRLKKSLDAAGIADWGAGARLAEITGRTPKAASKWLNGETMPGRANMQAIADELKVRIEWLQYGEGEMNSSAGTGLTNVTPISQTARLYRYPVISEVAAGNWTDAEQPYEPGGETDFEYSDYQAKGAAFWLRVDGESMTSDSYPSFPEGTLILVDTGFTEKSGDFVVAKRDTENEATFKKLLIDVGQRYLKPLNKEFKTIQIDASCRIIGVVKEAKIKL